MGLLEIWLIQTRQGRRYTTRVKLVEIFTSALTKIICKHVIIMYVMHNSSIHCRHEICSSDFVWHMDKVFGLSGAVGLVFAGRYSFWAKEQPSLCLYISHNDGLLSTFSVFNIESEVYIPFSNFDFQLKWWKGYITHAVPLSI